MASYDDSSSDEDASNYTSTSVLLGYASNEPTDDTISHLGGTPTWLSPTHPPPASLARCKACSALMPLLLELNGDLPERFPGHERRLYVFGCRGKKCARKEGSIRVVRGVRVTAAPLPAQPKQPDAAVAAPQHSNVGETLFGASSTTKPSTTTSNPFSSPSITSTTKPPSNPFSSPPASTSSDLPPASSLAAKPAQLPETFASKLSLNLLPPTPTAPSPPAEPYPSSASPLLPTPYPHSHLDADYETLSLPSTPSVPTVSSSLPTDDPSSSSSTTKEDPQTFESTLDTTFQSFADTLASNPEQVLRYDFAGHPLLYSRSDAVGRLFFPPHASSSSTPATGKKQQQRAFSEAVPRCGRCGAERAFEAQLVPGAIIALEQDDDVASGSQQGEGGVGGMEWGTVLVGVCSLDCAEHGEGEGEGYVEEWAGVQWEEAAPAPARAR